MVDARCIANRVYVCIQKKTMATPRMNDASWVDGLPRARATIKYAFVGIHVLAPLRGRQGVAPVVMQTSDGYFRAPVHMEAAFELCLRHLHRMSAPWPDSTETTPQGLLANRAMEALKLPGRFVPTAEGKVIVMEPPAKCHDACQAGPLQEASAIAGPSSTGAEQMAAPEATTPTPREDGQYAACNVESGGEDYHTVRGLPHVDAVAEGEIADRSQIAIEQAAAFPMHACQPEYGATTAESPASKPEGETDDVTPPPSVAESEGEAEQAAAEPSTDPTIGEAIAKETRPPLSTLSKKARRRAAQKARKRGR
jgi:hypothetical protein